MEEIGSLIISNVVTLVGAVWYLSSRISMMQHKIEVFGSSIQALEKDIEAAREGRSKLWEKQNLLSERVTIQEMKSKSTMVGMKAQKD